MTPVAVERSSPCVSLHIGSSIADAWSSVIRPWLESAALAARSCEAQVAVVTPFRSHGYAIKRRLLDCGVSLLGVRFVSPADLRELLSGQKRSCLALPEHLRLL